MYIFIYIISIHYIRLLLFFRSYKSIIICSMYLYNIILCSTARNRQRFNINKKTAIGEQARDTYRNRNIETTRFRHHLGPAGNTWLNRRRVASLYARLCYFIVIIIYHWPQPTTTYYLSLLLLLCFFPTPFRNDGNTS